MGLVFPTVSWGKAAWAFTLAPAGSDTGFPDPSWVKANLHRITEWQGLKGTSVGHLVLPKQGHLQQAAQGYAQAGFEYLQRRRLHHLPGQPVPVLCHPQREEVLPHVQMELCCVFRRVSCL